MSELSQSTIAKQAQELKRGIRHDYDRIDEIFRVEVEGCLLDSKGMPVNALPLIKELQDRGKDTLDFEYGICQFEYKTSSPVTMDKLCELNLLFEDFIEYLEQYRKYIKIMTLFLVVIHHLKYFILILK
jgi:hypothetical protein